jgi:hypothetical protein
VNRYQVTGNSKARAKSRSAALIPVTCYPIPIGRLFFKNLEEVNRLDLATDPKG